METEKSLTRFKNCRGKKFTRYFQMAVLIPLFAFAGCASSYDCYTCGRVSCSYEAPNPLPYELTQASNCTDSIGQNYLANLSSENVSSENVVEEQ